MIDEDLAKNLIFKSLSELSNLAAIFTSLFFTCHILIIVVAMGRLANRVLH